jgi:putative PIN family toxin of toxin-antitoxin system
VADDVLALGRAGVIEIYISPAIIDEIAGVLARKFGWSAPRIREAKRAISDFTVLVHPTEPVNVVREDEADNRILECALAAGADTIITGDHHLLRLRRFFGMQITTPREFLMLGPDDSRPPTYLSSASSSPMLAATMSTS